MDLLGVGLLLIVGVFAFPAVFILVVAVAYVRMQRGQRVDISTGASAYTVILLGASALVLTAGVASLLTALMGEIDFDYTYGESSEFGGDFFDGDSPSGFGSDEDQRQEQDVATGLGLVIAAVLAGAFHFWLRSWLKDRGSFDSSVEGAWDTFVAIAIGVVVLVLVSQVLNETLSRAIVTEEGSSPGGTIAAMIAFIPLWAAYGYRTLRHLGVFAGRRAATA